MVSDFMVEQMVKKVLNMFPVPGTSFLGLIEDVKKNKKIKYIQVKQEQTADLWFLL